MKYRELPQAPSAAIVLRCDSCDTDYSATRGDYWHCLEAEAHCGQCRGKLALLQRVRSYRKVRQAS